MNRLYFTILLLFVAATGFASHIVGGEMIYEYLGPGTSANTKSYRITLRLFRDQHCTGCAAMPGNVWIGIYSNDDNSEFASPTDPYWNISKDNESSVPVNQLPSCITNAPNLDYHVATYILVVSLPVNKTGYTAAYQTCCRVNPLANVFNTTASGGGGGGTGSTYSCNIPGSDQLGATDNDNSPQFDMGVSVICYNKPFTLNFSAKDVDGDSLVYSFSDAYNGGSAVGSNNINPSLPPYESVPYINGFSSDQPLGTKATIDSKTGIISGIAPGLGEYVVSVSVDEYRKGKRLSTHRKDFIVNVNNCDFAGAELLPSYITCDGFSYTFKNFNTSSLNKTFYWDFGDDSTSTDPVVTHNYADTGAYPIKLIVNKGQDCSDSAKSVIKVYPGFEPGFKTKGICVTKPTQFIDTTHSKYGTVNYWNWSFGDPSSADNTSLEQNPLHAYPDVGSKNIQFIVGNTKGCMDTIYQSVEIIDKPPLQVAFNDTLICVGDKVQLKAIGDGNFTWTPTANVLDINTATPTVTPAATTYYTVELDDNGCKNRDTVQVRVVNAVTLKARGDTTICATDPVQLYATTNGFEYEWTPAETIDNPTSLNPIATPSVTTTYQITSRIGGCSSKDNVVIRVVPYPVANAGMDTTICYGTSAQLRGSITGNSFAWSPASSIVNINSLVSVVNPIGTTSYILFAMDTIGCPKPGIDTITVKVLPKIIAFAGNDTSAVVGQPLQFLATGGTTYLWTPGTSLSDIHIPNPVGVYDASFENIKYKVFVANEAGCLDSAYVSVKVFKTDPRIFVPTAFTPNGDGKNDVFRPIGAGIAKIEYFEVYNRWGQLVFSTTVDGKGWDGKINGKDQATGTYVWQVKAIDYKGKEFYSKGTVTLIR